MTPREYLDTVVRPNVEELHKDYDSIRLACNAIASVDALAAHIFYWCKTHAPQAVAPIKKKHGRPGDDDDYRRELANKPQGGNFGLVSEVAKAQKHVRLIYGNPQQVRTAEQMTSRPIRYGEGPYGGGRYGGPPQVVIDTDAGELCYVEHLANSAVALLEGEMNRLGM